MKHAMKNDRKNKNKNKVKNKDKVKKLDREFSEYGRKALEWRRKCELMLPQIVEFEVWKAKAFSSVYEYAAKKAGMSKYTVNEALRVMKKIEDKPVLKEVAVEKGLGAIKPVVTIASKEDAGFWAEKAGSMSRRALETYVKNYRESGLHVQCFKPDGVFDDDESSGGVDVRQEKVRVTVKLRVDLLDRLKKHGDLNEMMEKFLDFVESESVGGKDEEKPKSIKTESRHVPVKIQRYVKSKTGGNCAFPGCCRKGKELHHIKRWAIHRKHDPDQMTLLCEEHHKLVHLGLVKEGDAVENWRLKL
jgi:hypothetical protein